MRSTHRFGGTGFALALLVASLRADTTAHAAIVKEREAVLSKIVAAIEARHSMGTASEDAVWSAKLALHAFQRDTAKSADAKVQHQEEIVSLEEKRLNALKARAHTSDPLDLLRATDAVLAAKQLLEEMRSPAKEG